MSLHYWLISSIRRPCSCFQLRTSVTFSVKSRLCLRRLVPKRKRICVIPWSGEQFSFVFCLFGRINSKLVAYCLNYFYPSFYSTTTTETTRSVRIISSYRIFLSALPYFGLVDWFLPELIQLRYLACRWIDCLPVFFWSTMVVPSLSLSLSPLLALFRFLCLFFPRLSTFFFLRFSRFDECRLPLFGIFPSQFRGWCVLVIDIVPGCISSYYNYCEQLQLQVQE